MEIQSFILAEQITRHPDNRHDAKRIGVAFLECTARTPFPFRCSLPGLILLRRDTSSGDKPFRLRFDLVDEDGLPAGHPRQVIIESVFPEGPRFFQLLGDIHFTFPRPGRYCLDIRVDEGPAGSVYSYNIDLLQKEV